MGEAAADTKGACWIGEDNEGLAKLEIRTQSNSRYLDGKDIRHDLLAFISH
jgi:hypothetical protein